MLMGIATAGVGLATGNIAMKLSPAGQATSYLAASSVVSASCAALGPIIGGLCADFFMVHELNLAFTWKSWWDATTVQVLNLHGWTFFFGLAFVVGLVSLHRLSLRAGVGAHHQSAADARSAAGSAQRGARPFQRRRRGAHRPGAASGPRRATAMPALGPRR